MKIANPRVTLADEARAGVDEAVRSGFLDWLHQFSLTGDDGELYSVGGAIFSMSLEKLDVVTLTVARGEGQSRQLPESIYKVTEYPGMLYERMWRQPAGSLSIERGDDCVRVSCGPQYPEGKLTITHEDWAFLRELDGFIPTTYHISIEVADGRYEAEAHVCNATTWGATHRVPDNPVATLTYGRVTGTFTQRDGTVRVLTGGRGTMSIRQWHAYPHILPRELYSDEPKVVACENKFDTL